MNIELYSEQYRISKIIEDSRPIDRSCIKNELKGCNCSELLHPENNPRISHPVVLDVFKRHFVKIKKVNPNNKDDVRSFYVCDFCGKVYTEDEVEWIYK